ncbi:hypothetical protein JRQ81_004685 [Phrynocephalus forsythii]|uniref:Ig-like domain-containing protein n=1 Tax=Phrynocephalus forsythii TaxID=171643 RepID=A0A9Q1AVF6_9SAUR|nr:hypothetical protein JRQ81_004685 [Phrynocephalus forsythii]
MVLIYLICVTLTLFEGSDGQIIITQTPSSFQANSGDTVTFQCTASSSVSGYMNLYQFKPGQNPKLLIYSTSNRFGGTPDRFSGSGSGTSYSFTINGVRPEDEGEYYCGQDASIPLHSDTFQYKNRLVFSYRKSGAGDVLWQNVFSELAPH